MRRWGIMVVLLGMVGTAGVVGAYEGEDASHGEMPAAMLAIKGKYRAQKEQLHQECKQKFQALEQAEQSEMQAAMKSAHEQRMQEMRAKHEEQMKNMEGRYQQHMQEMQKKREEHPQ